MNDRIIPALRNVSRLTVVVVGLLLCLCPTHASGKNPLVLDNEHLRLEVDPVNGAIASGPRSSLDLDIDEETGLTTLDLTLNLPAQP